MPASLRTTTARVATLLALGALGAGLAVTPTAAAADVPTGCRSSGTVLLCRYTGNGTLTLPANATGDVDFRVHGAQGGTGDANGLGSHGSTAEGGFSAPPGSPLTFVVGQRGEDGRGTAGGAAGAGWSAPSGSSPTGAGKGGDGRSDWLKAGVVQGYGGGGGGGATALTWSGNTLVAGGGGGGTGGKTYGYPSGPARQDGFPGRESCGSGWGSGGSSRSFTNGGGGGGGGLPAGSGGDSEGGCAGNSGVVNKGRPVSDGGVENYRVRRSDTDTGGWVELSIELAPTGSTPGTPPAPGTGRPDLAITTTAPTELRLGATTAATMTVTNHGTGTATSVTARLNAGAALAITDTAGTGNADTRTYPLGTLAPGQTRTLRVPLLGERTTPRTQLLSSVKATGPDADQRDNTDRDALRVR